MQMTQRFFRAVMQGKLHFLPAALPLALSGCIATTELPQRSAAASGPVPTLLPMTDILRQSGIGTNTALLETEAQTNAQSRADALRARAARLRRPVVDPADSQTIRTGAAALR